MLHDDIQPAEINFLDNFWLCVLLFIVVFIGLFSIIFLGNDNIIEQESEKIIEVVTGKKVDF